MRPARYGFNHLGLGAAGAQFVSLAGLHMAKLEQRFTFDDQKLFGLAVVVVAPTRDARVRREVAELPAVWRFEHFNKHTTRVAVLGHGVGKRLNGQIADVGAVQRPHQASAHAVGQQGLAAGGKPVDAVGQLAHSAVVHRPHLL